MTKLEQFRQAVKDVYDLIVKAKAEQDQRIGWWTYDFYRPVPEVLREKEKAYRGVFRAFEGEGPPNFRVFPQIDLGKQLAQAFLEFVVRSDRLWFSDEMVQTVIVESVPGVVPLIARAEQDVTDLNKWILFIEFEFDSKYLFNAIMSHNRHTEEENIFFRVMPLLPLDISESCHHE